MVENFFIEKVKSIPSKSSNKKMQKIDFKGDFKKLRGIVKLPSDFDYEDFRRKRLEEKYLK